MVMEPFDMAEPGCGTGDVQMQRGSAMPGQVDVVRITQSGRLQPAGIPAASRNVGLLHIDSLCIQHAPEVIGGVTIFSSSYFHSGGSAVAQQPETCQIVGRHRLLEPSHTLFSKHMGET